MPRSTTPAPRFRRLAAAVAGALIASLTGSGIAEIGIWALAGGLGGGLPF